MSDIISASTTYQIPSDPPLTAPDLRRNLLDIGSRLGLMMAAKNKMPEAVAKETGLSVELVERVQAGKEPDVGVRTLATISAALGCPFQVSIMLPGQPPGT